MELIIDNRESIKNNFQKYDWASYSNLALGDYVYKYNNKIVTIIERKTIEDLSASIGDGRYREQKGRLLSNFSKNIILYIIEGDLTKDNHSFKYNKIPKSTIYSTIINMYLRDNINVFHSNNKSETIEFLENIAHKIQKQGISFITNNCNYTDCLIKSVHSIKNKNINEKTVYKSQLCSIPGISSTYANTIIETYPNMINFITELSKLNKEDRFNTLKNLVNNKMKKKRKLGKKVAINIEKYLFFTCKNE